LRHAGLRAGGAADAEQTAGASFFGAPASHAHLAAPAPRALPATTVSALASASVVSPPEAQAPARSSSPVNESLIRQDYGQLPLSFEANVGQADPSVQFLAHGPGYGLYLTGTEAVMVLNPPKAAKDPGSGGAEFLRRELSAGINPAARPTPGPD